MEPNVVTLSNLGESTTNIRYMLNYPLKESGLHKYVNKYDILPKHEIHQIDGSSAYFEELYMVTLEECLKVYKETDDCKIISYSPRRKHCKLSSDEVWTEHNPSDDYMTVIKKPPLNSRNINYIRSYGWGLNKDMARKFNDDCDEYCASICPAECIYAYGDWCQYVSIQYFANQAKCYFFDSSEDIDLFKEKSSQVFTRISKFHFTLDSLNNLSLFQESDIYNCFKRNVRQTQTSLAVYKNNTEKGLSRIRRGFFDSIGNFFKNVAETVVDVVKDTAETVINTAKGVVDTVGNLAQGDFEGAKDAFLAIPVVGDIKTGIELGMNVISGDWDTVKEKGLDLLGSSTLDILTSVAIPVGGKAVGAAFKYVAKSTKKSIKTIKKTHKSSIDNINNTKKSNRKPDKKKEDKNDKDNETGDKRSCKKRAKRATGQKRTRPGKDCSDDNEPLCSKPTILNVIKDSLKECYRKKQGAKCNYECEPGYDESNPTLTCTKKSDTKADWELNPKCNPANCISGLYPLIVLTTPQVSKYYVPGLARHITSYIVLFEKLRKLPIWSIALHQSHQFGSKSYNSAKDLKREKKFGQHPCSTLKGYQGNDNDYSKTGWDRGHLTPANVARWSEKARQSANLHINIAPQDPYTNQQAWRKLEAHVYCFSERYRSLVVTGICQESIGKTKSNGLDIPSCFWKMICYKDEDGNHQVVGFIGGNSKVTSAEKNARSLEIYTPVPQSEIRRLLEGRALPYRSPWIMTAKDINRGREVQVGADPTVWLPLNPFKCEAAMTLSKDEIDAWKAAFDKTDHTLNRGKNPRKPKKRSVKRIERGCSPSKLKSILGMFSLSSEDGDEGNNYNKTSNEEGEEIERISLVSASNCNKRVIGYYPSWGKYEFSGLQAQRLTHVIYAFLEMKSDGSIEVGSADRMNSQNPAEDTDIARKRLEQLIETASDFPHLKVMFAVGGWENSQYFSSVSASPGKRIQFIASVVKMIETYGFDGVDIDWEYPVTGGANEGVPEDKENYVLLMKELRQALDNFAEVAERSEKFLISFAGAAGQWTLDPGFNLPDLLNYADFANIMTYDYFGAWSSKWGAYTGPPSPLFFGMPPKFSGKTNADWTVKYYVCKTKEPHKLNMGLPFYGRFWRNVGPPVDGKDGMWRMATAANGVFDGGYASWREIQEKWLDEPELEQHFHERSKSPYAWNPTSRTFLGYENIDSLKFKINYAAEKNLGGIMIWAIDQDDDDLSLLNTVYNAPLCEKTDPNEINHKCSPIDVKRWWTSEDGDDVAGLCGRSAPLYKGFYPVCDPDDPGYSCCGYFGYCGSGDEYCKCPTCIDFGQNPEKIVEEPIKPSIPAQWHFVNADDGKRGRCGRSIPKLNNDYPICNPDDKNAHCCSNGNYCGNTPTHCDCDGCIDFKRNPNYRFGPKKWWDWSDGSEKSGKCGPSAPKVDEIYEAECDPDSEYYCCSKHGSCGSGPDFCDCDGCDG